MSLRSCLTVSEERMQDCVKLEVSVCGTVNQHASQISAHQINSLVFVQIKVLFVNSSTSSTFESCFAQSPQRNVAHCDKLVLFKFVKSDSSDNALYSIICSSHCLELHNKTFFTDNDSWYIVKESTKPTFTFNVEFTAKITQTHNPFQTLYDDTELTDFKLVGEDGQIVKIHGAVLAAQCPSVMKMIKDKIIKDGVIELSDVRGEVLQNFKDYLYLDTLPMNNLTQLLLLASKLAMPVLEKQCIRNIISTLTADNLYVLIEFSQKYKLYDLFKNILNCVAKGKVKVDDIKKVYD